jgi:sterol desaturase/sphingolipid hydroxylase (fatty acid hydroxylase superfamily)
MMNIYDLAHEWLVQQALLPILYFMNWMGYADEADLVIDWIMLGFLQIIIIALILRPLEKDEATFYQPSDQTKVSWIKDVRQATRIDILYSCIHRLGVFQFAFFYFFSGAFFYIGSLLHDQGFLRFNVELWIPSVTSIPIVSFLIYLVLFDFIDYAYHRISHRFNWWWKLHALHHSQRHLTSWSDNRNHLLDDVFRAFIFSGFGLLLGVLPGQYLLLMVTSRLIQSWQHGFYPYHFGLLKYLIVTPNFHRYHHAIGLGYEIPGKPGVLGGCNFGVLFPWWDMLFKTAVFDESYYPSGVKDYLPPDHFFLQQWFGIQKSWEAIFSKTRSR